MNGNWVGSDRRQRLPSNWAALRRRTEERAGGRCEGVMLDGSRCAEAGTDCDHIVAGDNHDLSNLQWLCRDWHHAMKTNAESAAARKANPPPSQWRPQEAHPTGLRLY